MTRLKCDDFCQAPNTAVQCDAHKDKLSNEVSGLEQNVQD